MDKNELSENSAFFQGKGRRFHFPPRRGADFTEGHKKVLPTDQGPLDGVKNVTDKPMNKAFLGVGF